MVLLCCGMMLGSRYAYQRWVTSVVAEAQKPVRLPTVKPFVIKAVDPNLLKPPVINIPKINHRTTSGPGNNHIGSKRH